LRPDFIKFDVFVQPLFKSFELVKNSKYSKILTSKQFYIFKILCDHYLKNEKYTEMYDLVLENKNLFFQLFPKYGYDTKKVDLSSEKSFTETLSLQNTVSVVITSYNHQEYIEQCIESVLSQTGLFKMEIILGDDSSTDNTPKILKKYISKYPDIFKNNLQTINIGMKNNLRSCFSLASSNFIAICEGDDYWIDKKKLHKQIDFLRKNNDCAMCFNWLSLYREEKKIFEAHPQQKRLTQKKISFKELSREPIIGNFSACCYRSSAVKSVPEAYYKDPLGFDWLFNMYIAKKGYIGFIKEQLSVYRIHQKGQWSSNSKEDMQKKIKRSKHNFLKHFTKKHLGF
jgi:glycosyltransferase involved in cell wall biosynthesis